MGKSFKYKKLPPVLQFDGVMISEQIVKIIEEYNELLEAYTILCRKAANGTDTQQDFINFQLEAFDLSQASQQLIHINSKRYGKYYNFKEHEVYKTGIKKNKIRGYYEMKAGD